MRRRQLLAAALPLAGATVAGCSALPGTGGSDDPSPTRDGTPGTDGQGDTPTRSVSPATPGSASGNGTAYTHVQPTGNRILSGAGSVPDVTPVEYDAPGRPTWLTALPRESGSAWAVATADGTVRLVTVVDGRITGDRPLATTPAGAPFALAGTPEPRLLDRPEDAARLSHPAAGNGGSIYVDGDGGVALAGERTDRADVGALPDARVVRVSRGRYALLGGRTDRYGHGALGDGVEASAVVLVDVRGGLSVETPLELDGPAVLEGIAPIAADLTGDGDRDLLVTVSDADRGARHVAVGTGGRRLASGPDFGTGFRWRHALAVGPFGPGGEVEFAAVETPHVGGTARFHRLRGDDLEVVAGVGGVSSHSLGSRNLDGGLGGDLDGDGRWELLVPTQRRDELVAVRRVEGGAEVAWRVAVPGELASNVTGVTLANGRLAVGAAGTDGTVRIWHPRAPS